MAHQLFQRLKTYLEMDPSVGLSALRLFPNLLEQIKEIVK